MFAVGLMGGLMPESPGEAGENPTLSRNRDHHLCGSRGTRSRGGGAVSYTHLTLPTILLV